MNNRDIRKKSNRKKEDHQVKDDSVRLNRYIANAGICSRREADELIKSGEITLNGKVVTEMGIKVGLRDEVRYKGKKISREKKVYILMNKPKDYITTAKDPENRRTVIDLIRGAISERVYPVGRLDRNTTGVLMLTNDGVMTKKLTHPSYGAKKLYHVILNKPFQGADMEKLKEGVKLEDGFIKPDEISYVSKDASKKEVGIELHSGKNRIVRRIFEALGYEVEKLDRVMFAGLTKKDIPRGRWRFLESKEIAFLKKEFKI